MANYKTINLTMTDDEFKEFRAIVARQGTTAADVGTDLIRSYVSAWNRENDRIKALVEAETSNLSKPDDVHSTKGEAEPSPDGSRPCGGDADK